MYATEAFSAGLAFVFVVQAYKEWKIISSFAPSSSGCREESRPMIEVPLEDCSSSQGRAASMNLEMYKVSISQGSTRWFDGEPGSRAREGNGAPHSSTLAWKIPWTEEPGRLQSMGLRRVGHD